MAIAAGTVAAASESGAAPHPDAELLRLGGEFDQLHAAWMTAYDNWRELEAALAERQARA
jgi:hypothetical protein